MDLITEYLTYPDNPFGDGKHDGKHDGSAPGGIGSARPGRETFAELVDVVAATDRMLAAVSALRADAIDRLRVQSERDAAAAATGAAGAFGSDAARMARRSLVAELACALRIPEVSAERLLVESETLVHDLAATRTALQRGEMSYRHATALMDHVWSLPAGAALQGPGEPRTLTQLRADAFIDLLVDGVTVSGAGRGIRATVNVTVPVLTLPGRGEEPGHLEGYGPIDPDTARRLAGHAPSFTRILTRPETGAVLSVGRSRYTVPTDLRRWLRVRDETCRFPGCNGSVARSDLDHGTEWYDGGRTRHDNLAHLCGPHHKLKTQAGWAVTHARDGTLTWTSPAGRQYTTEPATRIAPPPPTDPATRIDPPPFWRPAVTPKPGDTLVRSEGLP